MRRALTAFAFAALALPAVAQDALTPAQRDAVDQRIRDYLVENPEVIVEALEALDARRREAQAAGDADLVARHAEALFEDGYSHVFGDPDGDVTIVEFADYRCGYCKAAHPQVTALLAEDGDIRLVLKEFPILGPESMTAAQVAMAALRLSTEGYEALHDAMMTHRGQLDEATVLRLAEEAGLDPAALRAEMAASADAIEADIRSTYELARALGIEGTPSFVIGGRIVRGLASPEQMRALVAEARAEQG